MRCFLFRLPPKVGFANCRHFALTPVDNIRHGQKTVSEKWTQELRCLPRNVNIAGNFYNVRPSFKVGEDRHDRIVQNVRGVEDEFKQLCHRHNYEPLEAYHKVLATYPHRMVAGEVFEALDARGSKPRKRTARDSIQIVGQ